MSDIHLDTSFLIRALIQGTEEDHVLRDWLNEGHSLSMSTIAWAEFLFGPIKPQSADLASRIIGSLVPFGENEAEVSAILFNETGRRRNSVIDCMIAATALARDAHLATSNVKDFRKFEEAGLRLALD